MQAGSSKANPACIVQLIALKQIEYVHLSMLRYKHPVIKRSMRDAKSQVLAKRD